MKTTAAVPFLVFLLVLASGCISSSHSDSSAAPTGNAVADADSIQAPSHIRGGGPNPPKIPEIKEYAESRDMK